MHLVMIMFFGKNMTPDESVVYAVIFTVIDKALL